MLPCRPRYQKYSANFALPFATNFPNCRAQYIFINPASILAFAYSLLFSHPFQHVMTASDFYTIWLATSGFLTFALYGFDKNQAKQGKERVPERTLHLCALVGGFLGGWVGRLAFRHKTQKPIFTVILLVSTALHLAGIWFVFFRK